MVTNLTTEQIHRFIVKDFEGAWNSVAANRDPDIGRGNFMFALQAMILLEFAARLCKSDTNGKALSDFSNLLHRIEPKYFTPLPSPCAHIKGFILPHLGNTTGNLLLWALFDLVRNGLAHQYQQLLVQLIDKKYFFITLTGADFGRYLNLASKSRPYDHLAFHANSDDLKLIVHPEILFLDLEEAINKAGLLTRKHSLRYLVRPLRRGYYNFNIKSLENCLIAEGHVKI